MSQAMNQTLTCPNCQRPFAARIEQIIDVGRDPAAKARLLSGQTNMAVCPHCGFRVGIGTPILYHDPAKEMLLVYVPMELGLQQPEQERLVGDLVNRLMSDLPAEQRRGYMLQPRQVLTRQGLLEQILAADGVTPEMLEEQRAKVRLVETLLRSNEEGLDALIQEHDEQIDMEVLQIVASAAESALRSGRQDMAEQAVRVRDRLMALSTAGQNAAKELELQEEAIRDVLEALQALGDHATREDFMEVVLRFADDDERLQALVGLQYPLFDYAFFQELSGRINRASDGQKEKLEGLRDRLLELTTLIRQQQEAVLQAAVETLNEIANSEDIDAAVRSNLGSIDESFMAVLSANIQAAEQRQDLMASARLKQVYDAVLRQLQENAPPELRFISDLMRQESPEAVRDMLVSDAARFGPRLLQLMDAMAQDMEARGDQQVAQHLQSLREQAAEVMGQDAS